MKIRTYLLLMPALFVAACLSAGQLFAAQEDKGKKKDEPAGQKVRTPQETLKILQERMKVLRTKSIEFRISCILEFSNAPCKETVDYLSKLYSSEKNAGVHMAITQARPSARQRRSNPSFMSFSLVICPSFLAMRTSRKISALP